MRGIHFFPCAVLDSEGLLPSRIMEEKGWNIAR